jgi:hypothetical protein
MDVFYAIPVLPFKQGACTVFKPLWHHRRMNTKQIDWGPCCFCGFEIFADAIDPCRLTVSTAAEKWQVWFCHAGCFKQRLFDSPETAGLFLPAHF